MSAVETLLTAEEYAVLPDDGRHTELVRGRLVEMNMPRPRHGEICFNSAYLFRRFLDDNPQGRIVSNDSGVITERDPDTVRGADIAYYSYARVPKGPLPWRYLDIAPDAVIEVRSVTDRWRTIREKVEEYLRVGVKVVMVLDEQTHKAYVFRDDVPPEEFGPDDDLTLPDILPGFSVRVSRFFE